MSLKTSPTRPSWPDFCCVPAFVEAALRMLGESVGDRRTFATELGVGIPPGEHNPWHLETVARTEDAGLTPRAADLKLRKWLASHVPRLGFHHIRFSRVVYRMYEDVLQNAWSDGSVVGVGYDYRWLLGKKESSRHLSRLVAADAAEVTLADDSGFAEFSELAVTWDSLAQAVARVDDGFWIIGPVDRLRMTFV